MDEAIVEVDAVIKRIVKFETNFKKCSRANRTEGYLEGRLIGLDELWNKVCEADEKIETLKTDANQNGPYFEDDQFGLLEETYYRLKGEIKEQLKAFKPQPQPTASQSTSHNQTGRQQNDQSNVKLPKISLPTFDGSYLTWLSFKNRFTNLIHNNKALTNSAKLEYLQSCVKGDAETAIQRFEITDANYQIAWDRLNGQYDNKRILQDTQIERIIDRKEVKTETSKELRELLDVVQESLEALKNMQVDTTSWDPFMVVLVTRKLPFKTREEWEKDIDPKDVPTYAQLIAFLEKRFRTVESLELVGGAKPENENKHQTTYEVENVNQSSNYRANCLACNNSSHSLMKCETFLNMTLGNRNAFVNAKRICSNCLAIGHVVNECKSSKRCFKCGSSHHTLLHKEDFYQTQSQEPSYKGYNPFNRGQSHQNYNSNSRNESRAFVTSNQRNERSQIQQHQSHPNQSNYDLNPNANPYPNNVNVMRSEHDQQYQTQQSQSNQIGTTQPRKVFTTSVQKSPQINPMYDDESKQETLFPTAIVKLKSAGGVVYHLRALLDQCSDEVFIKESVAKMLGGKQVPISPFDVTGLEDVVTSRVDKTTRVHMIIDENEKMEFDAHIVKNLVGVLPKTIVKWPENSFKNIKLADTNFATPNNVDIMLGTQVYVKILLEGVLKEGGYLAQNTKLGWIISGKSDEFVQPKKQTFCGFTRRMAKTKKVGNSWSEKPRKYYAPQRNSNPSYLSNRNQPVMEYSNLSKRSAPENSFINHKNCLPPRLSLFDVNVNRLRKSNQIAKIVNNFEQRWKSSSGLATTPMLTRSMREMSIFAMKAPIISNPYN